MKLVIAALLIALAANTAALAQYVLDGKGRRYICGKCLREAQGRKSA